jgi:hypothetical protein
MDCDYISQFHGLRVLLALTKGIALERWSKGLSVMLEKMFGVRLVSKLRAILLMEADFNAMNKAVYGVRMLDNARQYKLIPEEIFSKQNCTANTLKRYLINYPHLSDYGQTIFCLSFPSRDRATAPG